MNRRIFITRPLPEPVLERLRAAGLTLTSYAGEQAIPRDALLAGVRDCDGLLCLLTDRVDAEVLDAGERLRIVANYAVGFDNVDVEAATRRGVAVTNTPDVLTETTADLAWALLLACARRLPEAEATLRAGRFAGWGPMMLLGQEVTGSTLGVIGLGRIGRAVARRAEAFGMPLRYHSRRADPELERSYGPGAEHVSLERLLAESDFVSLHLPLDAQTRHLIGEPELRAMRPHAVLINTARGPVVDEAALSRALSEGWIGGAGLDVYEHEPRVHAALLAAPNAILLPHVGSATTRTRTRMGLCAAENLIAFFSGARPANVVNSAVLAR